MSIDVSKVIERRFYSCDPQYVQARNELFSLELFCVIQIIENVSLAMFFDNILSKYEVGSHCILFAYV